MKIGFTDKVAIRLSTLQTGCPYELKLIHAITTDNMEWDEERLHKHWLRYEVRGEWFRLPDGELIILSACETIDELVGGK